VRKIVGGVGSDLTFELNENLEATAGRAFRPSRRSAQQRLVTPPANPQADERLFSMFRLRQLQCRNRHGFELGDFKAFRTAAPRVQIVASSRRSSVALNPANDVRGCHRARLPRDFAAALEQRQCRYAANVELGREVLLGLGVHFGETHPRSEQFRSLYKIGCHHFAGATPWRPEVDDYRNIATADVSLKVGAREIGRMSREQCFMALAAFGLFRQTYGRNAVNRVAVRADKMQCLIHTSIDASERANTPIRNTPVRA